MGRRPLCCHAPPSSAARRAADDGLRLLWCFPCGSPVLLLCFPCGSPVFLLWRWASMSRAQWHRIEGSMQFIYTMKGLGKIHPPDHVVLRDIWLSFLPGAKIGVLGLNGAGKSTLLRIMAGEDQDVGGENWAAESVKVGYLPQEPVLNPAKNVRENVEEGVAEIKALLDRYDVVNAKLGEDMSPEEMDKVMDEQS